MRRNLALSPNSTHSVRSTVTTSVLSLSRASGGGRRKLVGLLRKPSYQLIHIYVHVISETAGATVGAVGRVDNTNDALALLGCSFCM